MKLLFITNKFPPISCGVGDYTYKLARSLVKRDVDVSVLCSYSTEIEENIKALEEEGITVYSLMRSWDYKELISIKNAFDRDQFDVISLQFVPFAFHKKGLPFSLAKGLKNLFQKSEWHIMFHELWVGMESNAKFTSKVHGLIQKEIIKKIIKILKPQNITTNTQLYRFQIKRLGYEAQLLPLFSNIIKLESTESYNSDDKLIFALFGNIHYGAPLECFILELIDYLDTVGKSKNDVKFLFLGKCGNGINDWADKLKTNDIEYEITGKLSEVEISRYLKKSHYGLTTTPFILVEKSGTVASMLEHNLKVICVSRSWRVIGYESNEFAIHNPIYHYEKSNLISFFNADNEPTYKSVEETSLTFLNLLN
jgi:glycosyltransferase involved in cell wall biosynthesis